MSANIIYIASDVRSGSTILDLILGRHEDITSVGEIQFLNQFFRNVYEDEFSTESKCTCGELVKDCPFWGSINEKLLAKKQEGLAEKETLIQLPAGKFQKVLMNLKLFLSGTFLFKLFEKSTFFIKNKAISENNLAILDTIQATTKTRYMLDSSKVTERAKFYHLFAPERMKYIFLVRDGRAVSFSKSKWGISLVASAISWVLFNCKQLLLQIRIPTQQKLFLRYEDLCQNPETELKRVFNFLELPYDSALLNANTAAAHNIGGSPMRYKIKKIDIKLDEVWKEKVTGLDFFKVNLITSWLNLFFGYSLYKGKKLNN